MQSSTPKEIIEKNASEIARLDGAVRDTFRERDKGPAAYARWQQACAEFHANYDRLAFPGGYAGALDRIGSGDLKTVEAAICFLECRPYFFRSGYMFKDILRRCKRAPLSQNQAVRLQAINDRLAEWERRKDSN